MIKGIIHWLFPCLYLIKQEKACVHIPCILHWLFRFILAGIFLYSGYIKWESQLPFEAVLITYDLFPDSLIPYIKQYFPWIEMILGLLFLIGFGRMIKYIAGASTMLLLTFTVILTITYFRGIEVPCGCFGFDEMISPKTIARDSLMLIPALYLLCAGPLIRRRHKNSPQ